MAKDKYLWTAKRFDDWVKQQKQDLEKAGVRTSTSSVTRILYDRVLMPNNISLSGLIKDEIKIKKRRRIRL